jgi:hypothetical protein
MDNLKLCIMKKIFVVGIVCLLVNYVLKAQTAHAEFGLKGGVNISNISIDNNGDYNSRTGFYLGGLAHIHLTRHFAVQPEVMYSAQGADFGSINRKQNYINVPVLAQWMVENGFRLQTGPQIGFLTSAKNESGDVEVDIKDQLNTVDFAWSFGASYLFPKTGLGIDARYNLGISNINDDESVKARNRVFQVGAFYQFPH